jgi:SAM-dependent methyltransferase
LCTDSLISGWAWDSGDPEKRLAVEILIDGKPLAQVTAQQYREDLKDCGIGDGNHAFSYTPQSPIDLKSQRISTKVVGTDVYLHRIPGPIPPEALRERVAGTKDEKWFDASGAMTVEEWIRALRCINTGIEQFRTIVDFGCGCGRALRHIEHRLVPEQRLIGLDVDQEAIQWLGANYPGIPSLSLNPCPPGPLEEGSVDLIVSHSVFTHLPEEVQHLWLSELARILKHAGILITSVHGDKVINHHKDFLISQNRTEECSNFLDKINKRGFYHLPERAPAEITLPKYYGATFHTINYISRFWTESFQIRAWLPVFALNWQDVLVLQKN